MTRVLVVRLGSLGDLVHALPAVAAIHRAFPDAAIDWLVEAPHREFLDLVPFLREVVVVRDRSASAWLAARRTLRPRRYDVAIDFQGLLKSAALARLSGAARVIGFDRAALREPVAAPFYTERVATGEGRHVIQKNLSLAAALGAATNRIEFPLAWDGSAAVSDFLARIPGRFALLNPGAAWPNKRWPPDRFGLVARELAARHSLASVVLWGPGEREAAETVVAASRGAATLAPETGLRDLVALARAASLMISGDTGPTHIAAAVGAPIVALFGPTTPARNGPWSPDDISISRYDRCDCHYERRCRRTPDTWCLASIDVDEVLEAVRIRVAERPAE